ncbi:MAG: branched-chain amino acid ABC transporter permease [Anaerolineae bacterium]
MNSILDGLDRQWLDQRISSLRRPILVIFIAFIFLLPVVTADNRYFTLVLSLIGIYVIAVTGLDIVFGYSGQVSFGHAAFYGIGAYSIAILSGLNGWPFWASLAVGIVAAAVIAALIGWPSVKLVHHFLALVTIGVGEIARLTFLNAADITKGFRGISEIPRPSILGVSLSDPVVYLYLVFILAALGLLLKRNIGSSWWGRQFHATRTNPVAAETFATPLVRTRTLAFVVSAIYGAVAGALYASLITYVSPDTFTFAQSTLFFSMVLIGGAGTIWGPVLGVVLLTFINQYGQQFEIYQGIFYGLMIIIIVMFLPRGVAGSLEDLYRDHIKAPARRAGRGAIIIADEEAGTTND